MFTSKFAIQSVETFNLTMKTHQTVTLKGHIDSINEMSRV